MLCIRHVKGLEGLNAPNSLTVHCCLSSADTKPWIAKSAAVTGVESPLSTAHSSCSRPGLMADTPSLTSVAFISLPKLLGTTW